MKRKIIFTTITALLVMAAATGCQKTPDKDVVVDRSEGLPKDVAISKLDDGEAQLVDYPKQWKETMTRKNEKVVLHADVDITVPEIQNLPINEYKETNFDNKILKRYVKYFAKGETIYNLVSPTKDEVREAQKSMVNKSGMWGNPDYIYGLPGWISETNSLIEEAPDKTPKLKKTTPEFQTAPFWEAYSFGENKDETKFFFEVYLGKDKKVQIYATRRSDVEGTYNDFVYAKGNIYSSDKLNTNYQDLGRWTQQNEGDEVWRSEYKVYLDKISEQLEKKTVTKEEAEKVAEKILVDLEINGLKQGDIQACLVMPKGKTKYDNEMDVNLEECKTAVELKYYETCGTLKGYVPKAREVAAEDLPEKEYAPTFRPQEVVIVVSEDGLESFEIKNMADKTETIAENVKLLPFGEIKEKLADHLLYEAIAGDEVNGTDVNHVKMVYTVDNVQLRSTYINAFNHPDRTWLVPTWIFTLD